MRVFNAMPFLTGHVGGVFRNFIVEKKIQNPREKRLRSRENYRPPPAVAVLSKSLGEMKSIRVQVVAAVEVDCI